MDDREREARERERGVREREARDRREALNAAVLGLIGQGIREFGGLLLALNNAGVGARFSELDVTLQRLKHAGKITYKRPYWGLVSAAAQAAARKKALAVKAKARREKARARKQAKRGEKAKKRAADLGVLPPAASPPPPDPPQPPAANPTPEAR